jgi:hypothetical protein
MVLAISCIVDFRSDGRFDDAFDFGLAQRFTAAITALFSESALAAEVRL